MEDGYAARVMSGYIDLNPLRAGIVSKPEKYRWCGYGEAVAESGKRERDPAGDQGATKNGGTQRREVGVGRKGAIAKRQDWREAIHAYRVILFTQGEEKLSEDEVTGEIAVARRGVSREAGEMVRAAGGTLSVGQMLRFRIRHFVDGAAIGRQAYLDEIFETRREQFGPRRRDGGRRIRGCRTELRAMRDLQGGIG